MWQSNQNSTNLTNQNQLLHLRYNGPLSLLNRSLLSTQNTSRCQTLVKSQPTLLLKMLEVIIFKTGRVISCWSSVAIDCCTASYRPQHQSVHIAPNNTPTAWYTSRNKVVFKDRAELFQFWAEGLGIIIFWPTTRPTRGDGIRLRTTYRLARVFFGCACAPTARVHPVMEDNRMRANTSILVVELVCQATFVVLLCALGCIGWRRVYTFLCEATCLYS